MKTCLCLGGADTLFDDIDAYTGPIDGVVACNDAGAHWPGELDAWVSIHPLYFDKKKWCADRAGRGYPEPKRLVGTPVSKDEIWSMQGDLPGRVGFSESNFPGSLTGSSGMFAAKYALIDLGFDRVVLCGIPISPRPHFWDVTQTVWHVADQYQRAWLTIPAEYRRKMRSMSGWTRLLLGPPKERKDPC